MGLKTNLVLGTVFLALLAFVYFYEIRGGAQRRETAEKAKELLAFDEGEAKELVIDRGDTVIILEREEGKWIVRQPAVDEADQSAVERYLRNLQETERERAVKDSAEVAANPGLVAGYGLDRPRLKVALRTGDGWLDTVVFGAETPTERYAYVQQRGPNPGIFMVQAWRFDNLNKGVFDLRDRRVLPFARDEVAELRLARQDTQVVVVREGSEWRLQAPVQAPADQDEVNNLLNRLQSAQVEAFVAEKADAEALNRYSLGSLATLQVSLLVGQDRAERRLGIGQQADQGGYYAQDMSAPQVFLVDSSLVTQLRKSPAELRDRTPASLDREAVTRLELEKPGSLLAAEKDTAGTWRIVLPEAREARSWKLDQLVTDLAEVKVEEFVAGQPGELAQYGLQRPRLVIRLLGAQGEILSARLGTNGVGQAFLKLGDEAQVYRIDAARLADLDVGLEEVAQPPLAADAAPDTGAAEAP